MSRAAPWRRWLAGQLMRQSAARLRRRYPDFAEAMVSEGLHMEEAEQLRWAAGCLKASLRVPGAANIVAYPMALTVGVGAMILYQWSADENVFTLILACALGLALGMVDPRRFLLSGLAVGLVVSGVNAFETVTGILPPYEAVTHGLLRNLRWMVLVPPAVISAAIGRELALRLSGRAPPFSIGD